MKVNNNWPISANPVSKVILFYWKQQKHRNERKPMLYSGSELGIWIHIFNGSALKFKTMSSVHKSKKPYQCTICSIWSYIHIRINLFLDQCSLEYGVWTSFCLNLRRWTSRASGLKLFLCRIIRTLKFQCIIWVWHSQYLEIKKIGHHYIPTQELLYCFAMTKRMNINWEYKFT